MGSYASRASVYGWFAALVLLWVLPLAAHGGLIILDSSYGNTDVNPSDPAVNPYLLAAGTSGQQIYIYASGGDLVQSVALNVEIGGDDGISMGTNPGGPKITAVNMISTMALPGLNTVFDAAGAGNTHYSLNQGYAGFTAGDSATRSQFWSAYITANAGAGPVPLGSATTPQLLAVVTLDTTGVAMGTTWALNLDASIDPSAFTAADGSSVPVKIVDGIIQISGTLTPEPASIGLLGLGAAGLLLRRRRIVPANALA